MENHLDGSGAGPEGETSAHVNVLDRKETAEKTTCASKPFRLGVGGKPTREDREGKE